MPPLSLHSSSLGRLYDLLTYITSPLSRANILMLANLGKTAQNRSFAKARAPTSRSVVSAHLSSYFRRKNSLVRMSSSASSNSAFVAAIDQGTSSTRVILYNSRGESLVTHQVPLKLITPSPGWVEQDPMEILDTVKVCMQQVAEKAKEQGFTVSPSYIKAIGITNQRETTVVWDKTTGKPLYNTIGMVENTQKLILTVGPFFGLPSSEKSLKLTSHPYRFAHLS